MAVVATTTYLYNDANLNPYYVLGSQLTDRGAWSSSAFYTLYDVIQIGIDQYVALQPNSNTPPTAIVDENWSSLVIVEEASGSSVTNAGSDYYARYLATQALETAWTGTSLGSAAFTLATAGSNLAWEAYQLALNGTDIPPLSTLPDVSIPSPEANQVLVYDGTYWTAGSLNADLIAYGRNSFATVGDALDSLFYVTPSVTSFTNDIGTVETGGSISVVHLAWSYNKTITSQAINQGIGSLAAALRAFAISGAYTTTTTFTLTASDGINSCNGNTSVTFMQKRYWGNSASTSLNDAQIIALSSEFASSRVQSKTVSPAGQYVYFCYPASFGAATFTVNGLLNTDWILSTQTFVNASGYSSSYRVYRSTNLLTGTYVIAIS